MCFNTFLFKLLLKTGGGGGVYQKFLLSKKTRAESMSNAASDSRQYQIFVFTVCRQSNQKSSGALKLMSADVCAGVFVFLNFYAVLVFVCYLMSVPSVFV